jgi:hypothetical protein
VYSSAKTEASRAGRPPTLHRGFAISSPTVVDPEQFAKFKGMDEIRRPDLAAHPALHGEMV